LSRGVGYVASSPQKPRRAVVSRFQLSAGVVVLIV
jgi:hypothetical protein